MPKHECIGPPDRVEHDIRHHSDALITSWYENHQDPRWNRAADTVWKNKANLRRWKRTVAQEYHRRGLGT